VAKPLLFQPLRELMMVEFFRALSADKHVFIEILGGDMDGRTYDSLADEIEESRIVDHILYYTNNGQVGARMSGNSLANEENNLRGTSTGRKYSPEFSNVYTVAEHINEGHEILIRMQYGTNKVAAE
jgi:hypothetical protein